MWGEVRDWVEELACRAGFDGLPQGSKAAAIAIAACLVGSAAFVALRGGDAGPIGNGDTAIPSLTATTTIVESSTPVLPQVVTVHVVGEVRHPGVYELPVGSRASDAVDAAGGLLGDADQRAVNLARVVMDGEQISVPREGEVAAVARGGPGAGPAAGGKVDLNTASVAELDTLPGVGPSTAQKIVADRAANGPFRGVEDLMRVPGIGPAKFDALKDLVTTG